MRAILKLGFMVPITSAAYFKIYNGAQKTQWEPSILPSTCKLTQGNVDTGTSIKEALDSLLRPLVLCGPSGSGKSTFIKRVMEEYKDIFGFSISHTTRSPRPGELNGREYHFVSREQFLTAVSKNEFIEWMEYSGNLYGTTKVSISSCQDRGKICILDIDVQGVKQIKTTDLNPRLVFIKPSSWEVLRERLINRGSETATSLEQRLSAAKKEMEYGEETGNFHLIIVNDNFERAWNELKEFLKSDINEIYKIRKNSEGRN